MAHQFHKEQFWRRTLAEWLASGLSVRQFCRRRGLSEPSFYSWRRQLPAPAATGRPSRPGQATARSRSVPVDARRTSLPDAQPLFLPVEVLDAANVSGLEVVLAHARRIRVAPGFDRDTLAQLVAVLEDQPC